MNPEHRHAYSTLAIEGLLQKIRKFMKQAAEEQGLQFLGLVDPHPSERSLRSFRQWLQEGKQAGMSFLSRQAELRQDPANVLPNVQVAAVFAFSYGIAKPGNKSQQAPQIAKYARCRDYHKLLKRKVGALADSLRQEQAIGPYRVVVDTAPLFERDMASRCSLGFIGKNTCYIHPEMGSFLLLASLLLTVTCPTDIPAAIDPTKRLPEGGCGSCRRCQTHCPTGALEQDYQLDARRCLSYWTIEHRGLIPEKYWSYLKDYWFGCDICQDVCPYNRTSFPAISEDVKLSKLANLDLRDVALMDQPHYEEMFAGSAMTRAKRTGLRRNAIIALYAKKDERLPAILQTILSENDLDIVVRDTAIVMQKKIKEENGAQDWT